MAASLVLNFFGLCRSKSVEDHGIVSFPKSWVDLHRFEGLGRGSFERSWLRLGARGWTFVVDFPGFCRSKVDGSSGGTNFVKKNSQICADLNEKPAGRWEFVAVRGGAWWLRC